MTPGEFREIAKSMKEFGISHVKMGDCEINCGLISSVPMHTTQTTGLASNEISQEGDSSPIEHKIEQMASLLKLSDKELVDQLFPDKSEEAV